MLAESLVARNVRSPPFFVNVPRGIIEATYVKVGSTSGYRRDQRSYSGASSAALGKLITMHKKVTTAKGKLALCSIQKDILDVFKITQLNKVLTLCTDLDDALSKF